MKKIFLILFILCTSAFTNATEIDTCLSISTSSTGFNECINNETEEGFDIKNFLYGEPEPDPGYDCSVYRNYRDRDGNYVCPSANYDACLKEYGPRLPPPYFGFVKHWCWCNCVYDPDEL